MLLNSCYDKFSFIALRGQAVKITNLNLIKVSKPGLIFNTSHLGSLAKKGINHLN